MAARTTRTRIKINLDNWAKDRVGATGTKVLNMIVKGIEVLDRTRTLGALKTGRLLPVAFLKINTSQFEASMCKRQKLH